MKVVKFTETRRVFYLVDYDALIYTGDSFSYPIKFYCCGEHIHTSDMHYNRIILIHT